MGRNKLLHRFYEPLVLLSALDRVQGDHVYSESDRLPLDDITNKELRRRFLNSLSYICDYKKGGDTTTAIGAAASPLCYYIASNKTPREKVKTFLDFVFSQLEQVYGVDYEDRVLIENELLQSCTRFSEERIQTYWTFLQHAMKDCGEALRENPSTLKLCNLAEQLESSSENLVDLCRCCYTLMRSEDLDFIRERVKTDGRHGTTKSPFVAAKHYIGRLAFHVKTVRVLLTAAERLPELVLGPEVFLIESPSSIVLPPPSRPKLNLDGIANRMLHPSQASDFLAIQDSLRLLNLKFNIEQTVRERYLEKKLKARVHAELIILEYFYERDETLQYLDNDRYIGCSKPACYCCSLYFREHPANVEPPATHQKLYLNWLPPTSVSGVEDPNSRLANHERGMLNRMIQSIRSRTIEQIRNQTGRRQGHFDSTTGETASTHTKIAFLKSRQIGSLLVREGDRNEVDDVETEVAVLPKHVSLSQNAIQSVGDSDDEGGVPLR